MSQRRTRIPAALLLTVALSGSMVARADPVEGPVGSDALAVFANNPAQSGAPIVLDVIVTDTMAGSEVTPTGLVVVSSPLGSVMSKALSPAGSDPTQAIAIFNVLAPQGEGTLLFSISYAGDAIFQSVAQQYAEKIVNTPSGPGAAPILGPGSQIPVAFHIDLGSGFTGPSNGPDTVGLLDLTTGLTLTSLITIDGSGILDTTGLTPGTHVILASFEGKSETITVDIPDAPEPASLPLLAAGLGGLGLMRRIKSGAV